jgi:C2H2-type zinc finger/C2H2 type zinc-finger (2 copies)/Zinc finger, C2H2 type
MVCRPASSATTPNSGNDSMRSVFRVGPSGRMKFKLRKPGCPCGVCGKLFLSKKSASAHMHKNHSIAEVNKINHKFKCNICLRGFETLVGLNLHRYRNHRLPPVTQALKYPRLLPKIIASAAGGSSSSGVKDDDDQGTTHECGLCFRICKTESSLKMHISTVHREALPSAAQAVSAPAAASPKTDEPMVINAPPLPENLECSICYQPFRNVNGLVNHLRTSHGKPSCNVCLEIFATQEELIAHRLTHKPGFTEQQAEVKKVQQQVEIFTCNICGKSFDNSTSLSRHKGYHTKMGPNWQPSDLHSSSSVVTPPTMRLNQARTPPSPTSPNTSPRKIFRCNICNKQFEGSLSLARHKACHTKLGPQWVPGVTKRIIVQQPQKNSNDDYEPVDKKPNLNDGRSVDKASVQKLKSNATSIPFCLYCKKIFESQNKLWDHICLLHPNDPRYRCQDSGCSRVFFSGTGFRSHQTAQGHNEPPETANSNKSVGGSGPSLAFLQNTAYSSQLVDSSSASSGITGTKCLICMRKFTNTQNLKRHVKQAHKNHGPGVQLKINPMNIVNTYSRKLSRVLCRYCPKYLSSKYISEHEKMHRIRGDKLRAAMSNMIVTEQAFSSAIEEDEGETIEVRPDMVEEDDEEQEDNPINADIEVKPLSIQLEPMNIPDSITITQTAVPRVSMTSNHSDSPNSEVFTPHRKTPRSPNCKYCGITLETFADLKEHLDEYHPGMVYHVCDGCPEIYYDRKTLVSHNIVHSRVYLNCKHCGKSFARPLSLRAHENKCLYLQRREQQMLNNSSPVSNAYNCEFCSEKFSDSMSFVQHLQSHAN